MGRGRKSEVGADAKASALLRERKARAYAKRKLERPQVQMWYSAKRRAKRFGLPFDITPEDIVIPTHCPVLGIRLRASDQQTPASPSLDRIRNSRGYTRGNIIVVSWRANNLKRDAELSELARLAEFYCGYQTGDPSRQAYKETPASRMAKEQMVQTARRIIQ